VPFIKADRAAGNGAAEAALEGEEEKERKWTTKGKLGQEGGREVGGLFEISYAALSIWWLLYATNNAGVGAMRQEDGEEKGKRTHGDAAKTVPERTSNTVPERTSAPMP